MLFLMGEVYLGDLEWRLAKEEFKSAKQGREAISYFKAFVDDIPVLGCISPRSLSLNRFDADCSVFKFLGDPVVCLHE